MTSRGPGRAYLTFSERQRYVARLRDALARSADLATPYLLAAKVAAPALDPPPDKRVPFGWSAFAVAATGAGRDTTLYWSADGRDAAPAGPARLRLAVAVDVREEQRVEALAAGSGRVLGAFDIRYAYALQPFGLALDADAAAMALREGVALRMVAGEGPLWLFAPETNPARRSGREALLPHLLPPVASDPLAGFFARLASRASVQPFGWLEGCVLDGLYDLAQAAPEAQRAAFQRALDEHLALFLVPDDRGRDRLVYENPRSVPADGQVYGIEAGLPFAVLARLRPEGAALDLALDFWQARRAARSDGAVQDGEYLSAEGSYTVAYPLAALARTRGRDDLALVALEQLRLRRDRLAERDAISLRAAGDGSRTFRNWARAYAWYLLGLTRALIELGDRDDTLDLRQECRRMAELALRLQRPDGLWGCFLDDPATGPDTSGSAGIAAALALAANHGLLPETAFHAAIRALQALEAALTPDGFLGGVSQANRGGEALQRSDYRVLSQMGMGLLGQLAAAVLHANP